MFVVFVDHEDIPKLVVFDENLNLWWRLLLIFQVYQYDIAMLI